MRKTEEPLLLPVSLSFCSYRCVSFNEFWELLLKQPKKITVQLKPRAFHLTIIDEILMEGEIKNCAGVVHEVPAETLE